MPVSASPISEKFVEFVDDHGEFLSIGSVDIILS
jgi:hypothetical protein